MLIDICQHLGVPLAMEKLESPTVCLIFLGIVIDTRAGELRLPQEKLRRLCQLVREWLHKKWCTKRELLSIAGQLQHAATVVRPGRIFLRRLFDLSSMVAKLDHHIKLNAGAWSDLAWWHEFLEDWNGVSSLSALGEFDPTIVLTSDASGSWGCGYQLVSAGLVRHRVHHGDQHRNKGANSHIDGSSNVGEILGRRGSAMLMQ